MVLGYTTGVFDLFHIGHLNLLKNAKAICDKLIVGVTTDELMLEYKHKKTIIPFTERFEIVRNIKFVDAVIPQESMDKFEVWQKLKFDIMFVGDDWFHTPKWEDFEKQFNELGVRIVYFPYTKGTSSTLINKILMEERTRIDEQQLV
jgi:glycerol-3-phosphate cytidylyltransferase